MISDFKCFWFLFLATLLLCVRHHEKRRHLRTLHLVSDVNVSVSDCKTPVVDFLKQSTSSFTMEPVMLCKKRRYPFQFYPTRSSWERTNHRLFHLISISNAVDVNMICAVESLFKSLRSTSDNFKIILWITRCNELKSSLGSLMSTIDPMLFSKHGEIQCIDCLHDFFHDTPLYNFFRCIHDGKFDLGPYKRTHLADALRLAILYHHGGTYFDVDFVFVNPITNFKVGAGKQDDNSINNAALMFPKGSKKLMKLMKTLVQAYDPLDRPAQGPILFTKHQNLFQSWDQSLFYPIGWRKWKLFLNETYQISNKTFGFHLWHHFSATTFKKEFEKKTKRTFIQKLWSNYCPMTYYNLKF